MVGHAKKTRAARAKSGPATKVRPRRKAKPSTETKPARKPPEVSIRPLTHDDRGWVAEFTAEHWGGAIVVAHGSVYKPERLQGFVAESGDRRVGLVTFRVEGRGCEVVTLNSVHRYVGIGTSLLEAVKREATGEECLRVWLVTTNDNLDAVRFFQRRGFELARVYRGAAEESRKLKPEIPLVGYHGIPIRDEIELELRLAGRD
jgi:N-acetylglutamate synthase-like GNAT family acetyltransferase